MKEKTKAAIKKNTENFLAFLVAHPVLRGALIGFALGLLVCFLF